MSKGKCYICNKSYSDRGMVRHVKACINNNIIKANDSLEEYSYLIKVSGKYDKNYYLFLLIDECVKLEELDQYLRTIWVECCDHLSSFKINETYYNNEDMNIALDEVLLYCNAFSYVYDFGSSTYLELSVIDIIKSPYKEKGIRLLGRNLPVNYECQFCYDNADVQYENVDLNEAGFVCDSCKDDMDTDMEEIYFSDIINSPRVGICGYCGPADDILFLKQNNQ